ncbi:hypothetical protein [Hymenobacter bucti]|uniref:Lipoprotein n=1 Tax=Hymenobacter bucti TaxID=1844114 RepID=A0ABW4QX90_9BACT
MKSFLRSFLPLLLGLLASCSMYDKVFHPRRLPTPDMTAEAKAKHRAAEKARHKGQVLKTEEITTNATDANAAGGAKGKADNKLTYSELPEGTRVKYDKELLLKKPKLKRRQYHHYDTRPLKHRDASRENRRLRKHSKGQGHPEDAKDEKMPLAPPTDASPTDEPTPRAKETKAKEPKVEEPKQPKVKEPKVKKEKEPKEQKTKKAPLPKPDPTQERPGY